MVEMLTAESRARAASRRRFMQAALSAFLPVACGRKSNAEDQGPASRVVSLSPSTTEAVFALGGERQLVGRSRYCDYPEQVKSIPSVGGFVDASYEVILGLAPDLVVGVRGPGGRALHDRLAARAIKTYFPETDSLAQIDDMLKGVGERLGQRAAGHELVRNLAEARRKIGAAVAHHERPRALFVFGVHPIVVAGSRGFAGELLELAGARNAVSAGTRYPTLGIEQVLALDPDVIIDATAAAKHEGEGFSGELPGWRELRSIRTGKLLRIRDERVLRPGPRISQGLAVLARTLHPELSIPG